MADAMVSCKYPVVPLVSSQGPHHQHSHLLPDREPQEQAKTVRENRLYIAPKHRTQPLALEHSQGTHDPQRKFFPAFDRFDLADLFVNRALSKDEIIAFAQLNEIQTRRFLTPERESSIKDKSWSSFKLVGNHANTSSSNKGARGREGKKSRPKEKGLRKLSQRAYEIVLNLHSASYKEVANRLVDELNNEQELDQEGKDEQNIKRRVYDALNVLIALGVLRKDGRKIVGDRDHQLTFEHGISSKLAVDISLKKTELNLKRLQLERLEQKQGIYRRMAEDHSRQERDENKTISFPFLALNNASRSEVKQETPEGEYTRVEVRLPRGEGNWGHFDIDMLVEFHRALETIHAQSRT